MAAKYQCQWGPFEIDVVMMSDEHGRDLLELRPTNGHGGLNLDSGRVLRRSSVTIVWAPRADTDDPLMRRQEFMQAVNAGLARLFVHPLDGVYKAKAGRVSTSNGPGDPEDVIEFIEEPDNSFEPIEPGASVHPRAGAHGVSNAAKRVDRELKTIGETSPVTHDSVALAESWADRAQDTDAPVDARHVYREREAQFRAIEVEIGRLRAASELGRYQLYLALLALGTSLGRAAESATAETASSFALVVERNTSLMALSLSLFGPENGVRMAAGIRALNRIDTPALVPAGTTLQVPVP